MITKTNHVAYAAPSISLLGSLTELTEKRKRKDDVSLSWQDND